MSVFPSIRIEGGLLGPDVLDQLIAAEPVGQKAADFGLDSRRNLTDEIASVFSDARSLWTVFQNRLARLPENDTAASLTRELWMIPFLNLLGYSPRYNQRAWEVDGLSFAVSHRAEESEDSPPVHIVGARQELGRVAASGRPRLSPHGLVQEYLNRTEHLWSVVTNGLILRLLRDSTFVRRQAYIEFDLASIFEEQRFQDFSALYRLLHRTRLPRGMDDSHDCLLEKYYALSVEQGGRVREHLRDGVEDCIVRLANGFLSHPANAALRNVDGGPLLDADRMFRELLRLVYRFLFLLVSEDRGLISPDPIYREHYSISRLRRLLDNRSAYTEDDDLWQGLRVLWRVFTDEQSSGYLHVAPLNGELFAKQTIDSYTISNRDLLQAFWRLAWYEDQKSGLQRRVNYAALDVEELGSVYESLLEFHPLISANTSGRDSFELLEGSERKTTGSYYTPPQLVNELIQSALNPVIEDRLKKATTDEEKARAILSIRVCDPACGSGHFLLAAARRLGKELARVLTGEEEPAPERVREATRDVISHCIYGVDKNPLAVDLCRVALWLESHTGGKPLTFLDHRIRCGDSLIGVYDLASLKDGIPDKAFDPLEGDDKATARALAKRNREERYSSMNLFAWRPDHNVADFSAANRDLDLIRDDSPEDIRRKKQLFQKSQSNPEWLRQKDACDLWTSAFFQPLKPGAIPITSDTLSEHLAGGSIDARVKGLAFALSEKLKFFHWPLEFPEVFDDGGFDVILSNPPWERIKLQEQEFFAARNALIANAPTKAARGKLIKNLSTTDPVLHSEYELAQREAQASSALIRHGGRYPLSGRGDINTYAVFAELSRNLIGSVGHCGIIVPSGIATDDTTKYFFQDMVKSRSLVSLYDFENRKGIFTGVHRSYKFCLLTCSTPGKAGNANFVFFALDSDDLRRPEKRFSLTAEEIALLNPNTGNCPIFRTQADAELTKAIYRRVPVLWREGGNGLPEENPWKISFSRLFDMANDSHHFRTRSELEADGYLLEGNIFVSPYDRYLPLYEAKMLHQFDHRWATYENDTDSRDVTIEEKKDPNFVVQPRYWVREEVVESAIPKFPEPLAVAVSEDDPTSIRYVLTLWAAGYWLVKGDNERGNNLLKSVAMTFNAAKVVRALHTLGETPDDVSRQLQRDFPIDEVDAQTIVDNLASPESLAEKLIERFSVKWFLGWRDICRSTDERTLISSAVPRFAIGNNFPLIFTPGIKQVYLCALEAMANSFTVDYIARQKVGGTHINYFYLKQFPILPPTSFLAKSPWTTKETILDWCVYRANQLTYTSHDLNSLALECGHEGPPFKWNNDHRFEIRCELDAAFFHLYLPSESNGDWRMTETETREQLAVLKRHFPTPREAVAHILDQFPIVRQKDEAAHGRFRTKERILEIYDAMQAAISSGTPYKSKLDTRPGTATSKHAIEW